MGFGPSDPSIAALLARLVSSPKVQGSSHALRTAIPFATGPLQGGGAGAGYDGNTNVPLGASLRHVDNPAGFNSAGMGIGGLASAIGASLNQQTDPLNSLYQNLLSQLQQPVAAPTGIDTEDLMRQVQNAINPIYDAREAAARSQAAQGQADVQGLYKQLAGDYEKLAPQQVAQAKDAQKQVSDLYGQLRSNIEGSYARVSQQQADEFKQLGIEAALPEVLGKQNAAVTDATTQAAQDQAAQQQRYADIGQMDSTFYREGSPISLMRGNEESTNILSQLQNYIQQAEGDRASGIQNGYLQQLGNAQQNLQSQQNAANSETARRQEMLWQMLQAQLQGANQQANQKITPDTFMSQLPSNVQQSVAGAFNSLQRSPEAIYGKVEDPRSPVPGTFVNTTPQWYEAQADQMLQNGQIDPATHQALLMYIQLYYGSGQ